MFYGGHHRVNALHVEKGFLLTGKGRIGHIFRGGRGSHGKRSIGVIGRQLLIAGGNIGFQAWLERGVDNPLPDLAAGLAQRGDIIDIGLVQQLINPLVDTALSEEIVKCLGGGSESIGHRHAHGG